MMDKHIAQAEWFDAVVARLLVLDPALPPDVAIETTGEVAKLPRWRELAPEIAAHRAAIRLAGRKAFEKIPVELRRAA